MFTLPSTMKRQRICTERLVLFMKTKSLHGKLDFLADPAGCYCGLILAKLTCKVFRVLILLTFVSNPIGLRSSPEWHFILFFILRQQCYVSVYKACCCLLQSSFLHHLCKLYSWKQIEVTIIRSCRPCLSFCARSNKVCAKLILVRLLLSVIS